MSDNSWPVLVEMLKMTDQFMINKSNYVVCTEPKVGKNFTKFSAARQVEQNEHDILSGFLPKQLSEEETKKICADVISKLGASSVKDMGKVMGELKKTHADEIDFAKAGPLIKELLNS